MSVPLSQIGSKLEALFSELKGEENAYARAANVNVIVLAPKGSSDNLIEALSHARPSRFFVVSLLPKGSELAVEVSAQCHPVGYVVSEGHYVCSEIVSITGCWEDVSRIAGIIRANVISGMPIELIMFESFSDLKRIRAIVDLAERIYFRGTQFSIDALEEALTVPTTLVDTDWIRLNVWREAIRLGYSDLSSSGRAGKVKGISISASNRMLALLLTGWIVSRLGLSVSALGGSGIECEGQSGERILVGIKEAATSKLSIEFERGKIDLSETKDTLELRVNGEGTKESHFPIKQESDIELLKRYLLIGESIANYRDALKVALEIEALDKRFR